MATRLTRKTVAPPSRGRWGIEVGAGSCLKHRSDTSPLMEGLFTPAPRHRVIFHCVIPAKAGTSVSKQGFPLSRE
jgi:hypothetical protein